MAKRRRRASPLRWYDDRGRLVSRPPKRKPERPVEVVAVRHAGLGLRLVTDVDP